MLRWEESSVFEGKEKLGNIVQEKEEVTGVRKIKTPRKEGEGGTKHQRGILTFVDGERDSEIYS